jgi:hypothetical protein
VGQKFAFRAGNSAPRAGISAPGQNFQGPEIPKFPALRNSAKSFTKRCGATLCKGAGNSDLAEFPGTRNFIISGPKKSAKSFTKGLWCSLQEGAGNSE